MDLGLENKVVLVLASSKGLGLACAKGFFRESANVVICSRSMENLRRAKQEILRSKSFPCNDLFTTQLESVTCYLGGKSW